MPSGPDDWTLPTLLTHIQVMMDERDRRYEQRYQTQAESLQLAQAANDIRLSAMNEFRSALTDQASTFLTKSEYQAQHQLLIDQIVAVRESAPTYMTRKEHDITFLAQQRDIDDLRSSRDQLSGKTSLSGAVWPLVLSFLAVAASTASVIVLATRH